MTESQVIALINQWIIANGNNEITADVLRPILLAMVGQPNDVTGDLSDLSTGANANLVAAINWLNTQISGITGNYITLHQGNDDPNVTPPSTFSQGDFYLERLLDNTPIQLWQYNVDGWKLVVAGAGDQDNQFIPYKITILKESSGSMAQKVAVQINSFPSFTVSEKQIPLFYVRELESDSDSTVVSTSVWGLSYKGKGTYGFGGTIISSGDLLNISPPVAPSQSTIPPDAVKITINESGTPEDILNAQNPPIFINAASDTPTIITTDDGIYWWLGAEGTYGVGGDTAVAGDFQLLPDEVEVGSNVNAVDDITALQAFSNTQNVVIVKDSLRGGVFHYSETGTVDNGTVFTATGKGSGYWTRQYNQSDALNVLWYGADPTGTTDNADLFSEIIEDYSSLTGKVFFPAGDYKISKPIGGIVSEFAEKLLNDVILEGTENSRIFVGDPVTPEISSVIAYDMAFVRLDVRNIILDGSNIANRGIYVRQLGLTAGFADFYADNVTVKNISIGFDAVETGARGIVTYGKFQVTDVQNCTIAEMTAIDTSRSLVGISVSGTSTGGGRNPIHNNIVNNLIKNIYKPGAPDKINQDAISIGDGFVLSNQEHTAFIVSNKLINIGGRFIKTNGYNCDVLNNHCVIESAFDTGAVQDNYAIECQHGDVIVDGNEIIYNNTTGVNYLANITVGERTEDSSLKRTIVTNNRVYGGNTPVFFRLGELASTALGGVVIVENNIVDADLTYFGQMNSASALTNVRKFLFKGNTVKSVATVWFNNITSEIINVDLISNANRGTAVAAADVSAKTTVISNIGITDADSYLGLSSLQGYGIGVTATTGTALPSDNLDLTTHPTGFYAFTASATGNPAASSGAVIIERAGATGYITQKAQLINSINTIRMFVRHYRPSSSVWSSWKEVAWFDEVVSKTSSENIGGVKTFVSSPIVPTATTANQAVNKSQMDTALNLKANVTDVPRQLKDFYTDVSNVGTTETDLYSHSITAANGLTANGQKYEANFEGIFTATSKIEFRAYYGGVKIFENLNPNTFAGAVDTSWEISIRIIRTGTTTARAYVSVKCAKSGPAFNEMGSKQTDLTGLNFAATNVLKITGAADGASGDITAKRGNIVWHPAAP